MGKSIFDPCPHGWKTPANGTWNDLVLVNIKYFNQGISTSTGNKSVTNGIVFNEQIWYPATGYYYYNKETLTNVGNSGCYWSGTPNETQSMYWTFTMNTSSPNFIYYRAFGFPVRCIQE